MSVALTWSVSATPSVEMALMVSLSLMAVVYLTVNQAFLLQIVLLEGSGGNAAVERGRRLVDPHWPLVLLLVSVYMGLHWADVDPLLIREAEGSTAFALAGPFFWPLQCLQAVLVVVLVTMDQLLQQ